METWDLEERIEKLRKKMIETALRLGIGHPYVYELSVELDKLHNEWQKNWQQSKYMRSRQLSRAGATDENYLTVV